MKVKIHDDIISALKKDNKDLFRKLPTEALLEGYINQILRMYLKKKKEM